MPMPPDRTSEGASTSPAHGSTEPAGQDADAARLYRFLDRLRATFAHDLGTPLGTIANYAAILEQSAPGSSTDVQDVGRRVGANAQRAARMLQRAAAVTALAGRPWRAVTTDLAALATVILTDGGSRGTAQVATPLPLVDVDVEVLGFVWRTYVAVENDARGTPVESLRLGASFEDGRNALDIECGDEPLAPHTWIDVPRYLRHSGGKDRLECAMGFTLAAELVRRHGGELCVWGQPGRASGLRVVFTTEAARAGQNP